MIYLKWLFLLVINLVTNLISLPLAPIVVLFANKDGWLPRWLLWFQTPDNTLDGDIGWMLENKPYRPENNHYQRWINRFHWLWRNRLYGFSRSVLSVTFNPSTNQILTSGDDTIGNGPAGKSGWLYKRLMRSSDKNPYKERIVGFEFYYIRQYKRWPTKCIRVLIGWKLANPSDPYTVCTFGFSPSPFMHFQE
jgi:hypothetical protein